MTENIRYCERFIEFLADLQSQLRGFFVLDPAVDDDRDMLQLLPSPDPTAQV